MEIGDAAFDGAKQSGDQAPVLRDVMRLVTDRLRPACQEVVWASLSVKPKAAILMLGRRPPSKRSVAFMTCLVWSLRQYPSTPCAFTSACRAPPFAFFPLCSKSHLREWRPLLSGPLAESVRIGRPPA